MTWRRYLSSTSISAAALVACLAAWVLLLDFYAYALSGSATRAHVVAGTCALPYAVGWLLALWSRRRRS